MGSKRRERARPDRVTHTDGGELWIAIWFEAVYQIDDGETFSAVSELTGERATWFVRVTRVAFLARRGFDFATLRRWALEA